MDTTVRERRPGGLEIEAAPARPPHLIGAIGRDAVLPFLWTRLLLVLVGLLATFYLLPLMQPNSVLQPVVQHARDPRSITRLPDALWLMWQRFDSGFYLGIAKNGYWPAASLQHPSNWAFYPLYPLLMRPLGLLFGGSWTAFGIAGAVVANLAATAAAIYCYLLVRRDWDASVARWAVLYLLLFPTAFYLSAVYADPVLLACSVASIYYARGRRWWLAGLCGGLAALSRPQGIALILPLAWELWQALADRYAPLPEVQLDAPGDRIRLLLDSRLRSLGIAARHLGAWRSAAALLLVPGGALCFMLYAKVQTGDFFATLHNERYHWYRFVVPPWTVLHQALAHPSGANPHDWNFWALNVVTALLFLGVVVWAFFRLPVTYALYTLATVLMPISSSRLQSISRYMLVVFPAFILLALWSEGRPWRIQAVVGLFAALQAVFMVMFVLGMPGIA